MLDTSEVDLREYYKSLHEGKVCRIVRLGKKFSHGIANIWEAITQEKQIPNWFLPISGDLSLGGNFQLEGNAKGKILVCKAPTKFKITWEFRGDVSWVTINLQEQKNKTLLTLSHIMSYSKEDLFWARYGPGATGVGWELGFIGLTSYLATGSSVIEEGQQWLGTDKSISYIENSSEAWARVLIETGKKPEIAQEMANETFTFYTELTD